MSTTTLAEHTVTVAGKPIFVAEAGSGAPVVMLHGGRCPTSTRQSPKRFGRSTT
jgi:hypothetical protein